MAESVLKRSSQKWLEFHRWLENVSDRAPYFRGHFDQAHTRAMRPRIGREDWLSTYRPETEKEMMKEFRREARRYEAGLEFNYWDWAVLAQHYGLPTRLLDWSRNPYVAAYFAVTGAELYPHVRKPNGKRIAEVIAVNFEDDGFLTESDEQSSEDSLKALFRDHKSVLVLKRPPLRTLRVVNQRSAFTVHGRPNIDFTLGNKVISASERFAIEESFWPYFEKRLTQFGFDRAFIDDNMEGVAKAIRVRTRLAGLDGT